MDFRDQIMQTLQVATDTAEKEAEEKRILRLNAFCNTVKQHIADKASRHTDRNVPFKMKMRLVCTDPFDIEEGQKRGSLYQTYTKTSKATLSKDVLAFEKDIRDELKKDGIIVGKWQLYKFPEPVDEELCLPSADPDFPENFRLYIDDGKKLEQYYIDPYSPFSIKEVEDRGFGSPRYTYTYIQDNMKIQEPSHVTLILPITFKL